MEGVSRGRRTAPLHRPPAGRRKDDHPLRASLGSRARRATRSSTDIGVRARGADGPQPPAVSAGQSAPAAVERVIVRLKKDYPDLGRAQDSRAPARRSAPGIRCPAISTVHAVLDRHGLVTRQRRRRCRGHRHALSQPTGPNDLWCADYKGQFMLADQRYCYPLTITDFATRYLIACDALKRPRIFAVHDLRAGVSGLWLADAHSHR